jgi:maltooligosyltrehalose trehalohydrolase
VTIGARVEDDGTTTFRVWAPDHDRVELQLAAGGGVRAEPMARDAAGYHATRVDDVPPGTRYRFGLGDAGCRPDPASRFQPDGPDGPSVVVDHRFGWSDTTFRAPGPADLVVYELHVGTFTPAGTFDAVVPQLEPLRDLGVTAIELMPIAQFPGERNWGYDGVAPFAAQASYGGPDGLRRLVDAAHRAGIAVLLDVVDNHLGPEGNHLADFGPYFTERYRTPWGAALNFDGPGSDEVRRFFVESARWWTVDCHVDGLRLDAVHAIVDPTGHPFVQQLAEDVRASAHAAGRDVVIVAESAENDARLVRSTARGGFDLDGVWSDDFHHALHVALTREREGYYGDYHAPDDLATALERAWVYVDRWSAFRGRTYGTDPTGVPAERFVVCAQNHDQIGNRARGERLPRLTGPGGPEIAAAAVLLSPFTPLLFMGEEYGEPAPFPYFVSHTDPALVEAVRRGRAAEVNDVVGADAPDPQAESTFRAAVLHRELAGVEPHCRRLAWYRALLALRRGHPALRDRDLQRVDVRVDGDAVVVRRGTSPTVLIVVLHPGPGDATVGVGPGGATVVLDSGAEDFAGTGSARLAGDRLHLRGRQAVVLEPDAPPR